MKRSELFFSFLLVPLDFLMLIVAAVLAYYIRFAEPVIKIRPAVFELNFYDYLQAVLIISAICIFIFALSGLYAIRGNKKIVSEFYKVIMACSTGLMVVVVLIFLRRELFDSRFIVLMAWILSIFFVTLSRVFIRILQRYLYKYDIGVHNVVLVGDSRTSDILMHDFSSRKNSGFIVVKRIRDFSLETSQALADFIKMKKVDEVIQSDPNLSKAETLRLFDFADEYHITFKYAADLLGAKVLKTEVTELTGIPIVEVKKTLLDGWGRIVKRFLDLIVSTILIILLSPLFLLFFILVKIDSKGPAFYKNLRVGKDGKSFNLVKFRSMAIQYCTGDDYGNKGALNYEKELIDKQSIKEGPLYKIKDDPRVTMVGRFIRRWSIDELPQLFNVFLGNMSLVGPRPHQPREVAKYEHHHKKVLTIKPGITGMAQISGRSDLSFEEEVKLDTYYIENWSLLLDLSLLLRTPWAVIKSREVE